MRNRQLIRAVRGDGGEPAGLEAIRSKLRAMRPWISKNKLVDQAKN